jgi:DNA topoisomerase-1
MAKTSKKKNLVIVESPAKAKTINRYLGPDFEVKASMGHIRDLPSKGLNVDIENNFEPTYKITPGRARTVKALKDSAKNSRALFLATDLDREGEAIAWHLSEVLNFNQEDTYRVIFNAITKGSIANAFEHPGKLNMDKVMAQQARRILDRIVGYKISPLLWKKVTRGLSAGRVQSVAVKIIVEREREIRAFEPDEYWLLPAVFTTDLDKDHSRQWQEFTEPKGEKEKTPTIAEQNKWLAKHNSFKADLVRLEGDKFDTSDGQLARELAEHLTNATFKVSDLNVKRTSSRPGAPFITSTLQQAAANQLGFSAKKTMMLAQQLYEGIDLGSMGSLGLITYMRTDSTNLSKEALNQARHYIKNIIGPDYLPEKPNTYTSRSGAQEAHEAIRPTDPDLDPDSINQFLSKDQARLYDLIWRRFIACQMTPSQWDTTAVETEAHTPKGTCTYRATGRVLVFDGFNKIWPASNTSQTLGEMKVGQQLNLVDLNAEQNFTKPPARYTEASLVKTLEKEGIGRPSTYASIISTIQDRKYVEKIERSFHATDIGEVVTDKLNEFFPKIMDINFTRHMEEQLDKIEDQHLDWLSILNEFYGSFKESLDHAAEEMKHAKAETYPSEYKCPECGNPLEYRFGKNGRFLSCSKYPDCKFAAPCDKEGKMIEQEESEHKCPNCGKPMLHKQGRYGPFLGCSGYPECKTILNIDKEGNVSKPEPPEPTGIKCHKCKEGELVIRKSKRGPFMGCNRFPKCRTIVSIKQKDELLKLQKEGKWPPETIEQANEMLGRNKTKSKKKTTKKKAAKKKKTTKKKSTKKKKSE